MSSGKVIDADGHIIERADELRRYLKAPFNKRGGPLTASEPWDRDLQRNLAARPNNLSTRAAGGGLAAHHGSLRHRAGVSLPDVDWATYRVFANLITPWRCARLITITSTITTRKSPTG